MSRNLSKKSDFDQNERATPEFVFNSIQDMVWYLCFDVKEPRGKLFNLDASASAENTKCKKFIDKEKDAFVCKWGTVRHPTYVWLNPPYSRPPGIQNYVLRALNQMDMGYADLIVFLLNADSTTEWHKILDANSRFVVRCSSRIKFLKDGIQDNGAQQASDIFILLADKYKIAHPKYLYFNPNISCKDQFVKLL